MKAAICSQYGPPEVLQLQEVAMPLCKDNEILVKIMATAVNSGDVRVRGLVVSGFLKIVMRLVLGFFKPRRPILGTVYAGIVVETGKNISQFKVDEKVFGITGFKFGTYAEYISVNEKSIVTHMPINASFEAAASLPFGWHTAIHFLERAGIENVKKPKVLIYGSTGSVGVAAVQLANYFNVALTVVCSSEGRELMRNLGVDNVICYDLQDFTQTPQKFDIIFDAVGKTSKPVCKHLLNTGGNFVTVGGLDMATEKVIHLQFIRQLFEKRKCRAIIDRVYPFSDIVAAHAYVDAGRKKGDVVVTMCEIDEVVK
ncbi:NADPH:quinone reductase [Pedobacter sp. Hv1]|nr:NADPH:quinone reductase [Pedobacter sp. Hv1]